MIRGVTVDWWHTMVEPPGDDWEEVGKRIRCEAIQRVLQNHDLICTYDRIDLAYDLWTGHLKRAWKRNVDWPADRQVADLLDAAGFDGTTDRSLRDDMKAPIGMPLMEHPPWLNDGVVETLRTLKAKGLRLAIISNTGRTWGHFLRQVQDAMGLSEFFDHRTFSDEARVRKPSPAIFNETLDALRLKAEEVVHVGDDLDADVAGAKWVGMGAVWYDTGKGDGASRSDADAVIHHWRDLPGVIGEW